MFPLQLRIYCFFPNSKISRFCPAKFPHHFCFGDLHTKFRALAANSMEGENKLKNQLLAWSQDIPSQTQRQPLGGLTWMKARQQNDGPLLWLLSSILYIYCYHFVMMIIVDCHVHHCYDVLVSCSLVSLHVCYCWLFSLIMIDQQVMSWLYLLLWIIMQCLSW